MNERSQFMSNGDNSSRRGQRPARSVSTQATLPAPAILAAALTPFVRGTEEVDFDVLATEFDWLVANGAGAVVVGGVETQEYQVLEGARREELIDRSLAALNGRCPAIVGVSHPSPARSRALAGAAARAGARAVMVLVGLKPWGAPPTPDEVMAQVVGVGDAGGLPVVVYTNPRLGVDLPVDVMADLATLPEVCAFKETSRDIAKIGRLLAEVDDASGARVYTTMEALLFTLLMGGPGAMMPPPAVGVGAAVVAAVAAGDTKRAVELQRLFATFPGRWMHLGLTPVMKAAMRLSGVDVGGPLAPYQTLGDDDVAAMAEVLAGGLGIGGEERRGPTVMSGTVGAETVADPEGA